MKNKLYNATVTNMSTGRIYRFDVEASDKFSALKKAVHVKRTNKYKGKTEVVLFDDSKSLPNSQS